MTTPTKKLRFAAKRGNAARCEQALAKGADPLETDKGGLNALHLAAMNGHAQACKVLLKHGADPQTLTSGYWTPLLLAVWDGRDEAVLMLLEYGANIHTKTRMNESALDLATIQKKPSTASILRSWLAREEALSACQEINSANSFLSNAMRK